MTSDFDKTALDYHRFPKLGKLEISATKNMLNQRDLALAYSPGVAAACLAIKDDPTQAGMLTVRSNLVGVITNGTAGLGLGNGALASKPVMEGVDVGSDCGPRDHSHQRIGWHYYVCRRFQISIRCKCGYFICQIRRSDLALQRDLSLVRC